MTSAVRTLPAERGGKGATLSADHMQVLKAIVAGSTGNRAVSAYALPSVSDGRHPSSKVGRLVSLGLVDRCGRGAYRATSKGKVWANYPYPI